mgnify:CR=1 FL=1
MANSKQFDELIRQKLKGLEAPYRPDTWDTLSKQLDDQLETPVFDMIESDPVDEAVSRKLNKLEPAYQQEHWNAFESRLDKEFDWRYRLLRSKIIETAVAAMVLFTFWRFWPDVQQQLNAFPLPLPGKSTAAAAPVATTPSGLDLVTGLTESNPAIAEILRLNLEKFYHQPNATITNEATAGETALATTEKINVPVQEKVSVPGSLAANRPLEPVMSIGRTGPQDQEAPISSGGYAVLPSEHQYSIGTLAVADAEFLNAEHPYHEVLKTSKPFRKGPSLRIGMFGSGNLDYFHTLADNFFPLEPLDHVSSGYGGGISAGMRFGKWEIESGLVYASKHYQPLNIKDIYSLPNKQLIEYGLKRIEINTIQLPFNVRRDVIDNNRWRLYALTGASFHVATQANYYKFESLARTSIANAAKSKAETTVARRRYADGFLEGGTLKENSYLSLNLGLGLERQLSHRWALFVQPTYQNHFKTFNDGIGPNQDRIHTLSIYTGAKVNW